ncbi:MAG TPA: hypothetical protein VE693_03520 [Gaiellaceae bacterium]|jgi:hypothetical protein|nr:hypothetical protein [Gaiellaceae bacterium]
MSVPATSPRRATFDAIAIALALLAVDAFVALAMIAEWIHWSTGVLAVLALAAVVLLLFRDDVADALAAGTQNLLAADDAAVRHVLDELAKEGWTVEHDVSNARGILIGSLVQGPSGAYIVEVRNRAYRLEHLRRARRDATWLHGLVGGWVSPVVCLALRDDEPHRRDGVWIMGVEHLADWLRQRTPPRGASSADD